MSNVERAAARVDYRLSYEPTTEPRQCHQSGIYGPEIRNAYFGRRGHDASDETGPGNWDDPDHPSERAPERAHIDRWFTTAVREAVHEALEWFWVDEVIYLDPHGPHESAIHDLSAAFTDALLDLRTPAAPPPDAGEVGAGAS